MQLELNQREPFDRRNASSVGWEAKHGWKKKEGSAQAEEKNMPR